MLEWKRGRNLTKYGNVSYEYDAGGIRQKKTVNGTQYSYWTEGGTIHREYRSNGVALWYYYDSTGIEGFQYNGTRYHYFKNLQGDIVGIVDGNGKMAAAYRYDAWGNHKVYDGNFRERHDTDFIGNINPFRYRGYYYDAETGLYYLQSRYYDPAFGRFINADDAEGLMENSVFALSNLNLYAYSANNAVMLKYGTYICANGISNYICSAVQNEDSPLKNNSIPDWIELLVGTIPDIVRMMQYLHATGMHKLFLYSTKTLYMFPIQHGTWRRFKIGKYNYGGLVKASFKQIVSSDARSGFNSILKSFGWTVALTGITNFLFNLYIPFYLSFSNIALYLP